MVTVGMNYAVLEGKEAPFEKKFALVLGVMAETPGHTKTNLYKDVFQGRSYLIVSEWKTREAFDAFIGSDAFSQVTNWGKETILAGRPSHEVYGDEPAAPITGGCPVDH